MGPNNLLRAMYRYQRAISQNAIARCTIDKGQPRAHDEVLPSFQGAPRVILIKSELKKMKYGQASSTTFKADDLRTLELPTSDSELLARLMLFYAPWATLYYMVSTLHFMWQTLVL